MSDKDNEKNKLTSQYILCDSILDSLLKTKSAPIEIFHPEYKNMEAVIKQLEDDKYIIVSGTFLIMTPLGEHFRKNQGGYEKYIPRKYKVKWSEKHPFWNKLIWAGITAAFSLLIGIILWHISNQSKNQEQQELLQKVENLNTKVDSLTNSQIYKMDSLNKK